MNTVLHTLIHVFGVNQLILKRCFKTAMAKTPNVGLTRTNLTCIEWYRSLLTGGTPRTPLDVLHG